MGDKTLDLKQDIKETNSKNNSFDSSFSINERKMNLDDEFAEQKIPDQLHESYFSETQEKLTTDDVNKNIVTLSSVDSLDSFLTGNSDLKRTGMNDGGQPTKIMEAASLVPNAEEVQRGRAEVIRLQAVSNNPLQSVGNTPVLNLSNATPEKSTDKVYINEDMDIITNGASQGEYILTSAVPLKKMPVQVTPNDLENIDPNAGPDLLQTAVSSITENMGSAYQQIMLDVQTPQYTTLRVEKTSDISTVKGISWVTTSSSGNSIATSDCSAASSALYHTSSSESSDVLSDFRGMENTSGIQTMERFVTADNQLVYGYKDSSGEMHFFSPALNERESHNEKERKRRSRVSEACSSLRKMIPGISEKTDKATVFEQTAKYLKFLREKFGTQFDQAYCEKYYQGRS